MQVFVPGVHRAERGIERQEQLICELGLVIENSFGQESSIAVGSDCWLATYFVMAA